MKKILSFTATLMILMFFMPGVTLAVDVYHCPTELQVNSTIEGNSTGLEAVNFHKKHFLESATFSDGHPDDFGFLSPKSQPIDERSKLHVYNLSRLVTDRAWLVCRYGSTPAVLVKEMPKAYKTCKVSELWDNSEQRVECE